MTIRADQIHLWYATAILGLLMEMDDDEILASARYLETVAENEYERFFFDGLAEEWREFVAERKEY
jgi:hypothetical protein